jgi:hypothetical protein
MPLLEKRKALCVFVSRPDEEPFSVDVLQQDSRKKFLPRSRSEPRRYGTSAMARLARFLNLACWLLSYLNKNSSLMVPSPWKVNCVVR